MSYLIRQHDENVALQSDWQRSFVAEQCSKLNPIRKTANLLFWAMQTGANHTCMNPSITGIATHHGQIFFITPINLQTHWTEVTRAKKPSKSIKFFNQQLNLKSLRLTLVHMSRKWFHKSETSLNISHLDPINQAITHKLHMFFFSLFLNSSLPLVVVAILQSS